MDSAKTRSLSKNIPKTAGTAPGHNETRKKQGQKFTEREKKAIQDLKKLYLETIKLDVEMQRDIYNLEKSYEEKHRKIFEQRTKIIENAKKADSHTVGNVSNFWLKVLKASYTEFISKKDEQILSHLKDIRTLLYNEPNVRFVIEFHFEPNEFFSNTVLTKTYFLNCLPDIEDPFTYDGAEIFKCEGCKIDWKDKKDKENEKKVYSSFFEFFNPPTLPQNTDDPTYSDINGILQNDFELGFYLKERVIPKAILFFTGEIADCQSSESETDDDTDDNDDDDDETGSSVNTPEE